MRGDTRPRAQAATRPASAARLRARRRSVSSEGTLLAAEAGDEPSKNHPAPCRLLGCARRLESLARSADGGAHLLAVRLLLGHRRLVRHPPVGSCRMCFDHDSLPPIPALSGAAVSHDDLVLEASDGNRFAAFAASPDETAATGVVILPDVRGLYRFYEELALRFAERGYAAVAFDYFGRTAGIDKRPDDWDYMPLVQQLTMEQVQADVAACVGYLREHAARTVFTVGFCFGGS